MIGKQGMNWSDKVYQSLLEIVKPKSVPVTIKYPEMVVKMFPYFENLTLPTLGRKSRVFVINHGEHKGHIENTVVED